MPDQPPPRIDHDKLLYESHNLVFGMVGVSAGASREQTEALLEKVARDCSARVGGKMALGPVRQSEMNGADLVAREGTFTRPGYRGMSLRIGILTRENRSLFYMFAYRNPAGEASAQEVLKSVLFSGAGTESPDSSRPPSSDPCVEVEVTFVDEGPQQFQGLDDQGRRWYFDYPGLRSWESQQGKPLADHVRVRVRYRESPGRHLATSLEVLP